MQEINNVEENTLPFYYSIFHQPAHVSAPITFECDSFEDICAGLSNPESYPSKSSCPGIKLAVFNGKRNDANLVGFSGIELDYDSGKIRPEKIHEILLRNEIKHFIYTTPTHLPFQPRFRVLVPFSELCNRESRDIDMATLTYLLDDSFASESRTASQFYYYGQVNGVMYETFYGDGDFIDEVQFDIPEPVVAPKTLTPKSVDNNKPAPVNTIREVLNYFKADDYDTWQKVGQRLKGLGDQGFQLWVEWSRKSDRHNEQSCISKWDDLKGERTGYQALFEIATSKYGWVNKGNHPADDLKAIDWSSGEAKPRSLTTMAANPVVKELKLRTLNEVYVLDNIALLGQSTVIYAASNSGKTLITLHSLIESVKAGRIKGEDVFYINADDNLNGAVAKTELLAPYGIQCLIAWENGFEPDELQPVLMEMMQRDEVRGKIIVLDTLTQFTNTMDKNKGRDFMKFIKQLTAKGATVIMLAHTNKTRGLDGKPIPEGTGDIKNSGDCAYVMDISKSEDGRHITATFINIKRRGGNDRELSYRFESFDGSVNYQTLLDSVERLDDTIVVKSKPEDFSSFDIDQVMTYIECNPCGITLKELNKHGQECGIKNVKQIIEHNMHRIVQIGDKFKLKSEVQRE